MGAYLSSCRNIPSNEFLSTALWARTSAHDIYLQKNSRIYSRSIVSVFILNKLFVNMHFYLDIELVYM